MEIIRKKHRVDNSSRNLLLILNERLFRILLCSLGTCLPSTHIMFLLGNPKILISDYYDDFFGYEDYNDYYGGGYAPQMPRGRGGRGAPPVSILN